MKHTKHGLTAIDFFLLLGILISLITTFVSGVSLLWKGLERLIPDVTATYYSMSSGVQNALAFFIVGVIVLYVLEIIQKKRIAKDASRLAIPLRKWMLLSVLFILGLVILGDLIAVIRYFLSGELTTRFIAKVLSLFMLSSIVFIYYFHVLTWDTKWSQNSRRAFSWLGLVVSILIIVFGFYLIGSPKMQRNIRIDQERENTLQSLNYSVINYWQQFGTMPATLEDLSALPDGFLYGGNYRIDMSTYRYELRDTKNRTYALCSTFNVSSDTMDLYMDPARGGIAMDTSSPEYSGIDGKMGMTTNWRHPAGDHCFIRTIDPRIYPVNKDSK